MGENTWRPPSDPSSDAHVPRLRHSPVLFVYLRQEPGSYMLAAGEYERVLHEWHAKTPEHCEAAGFYGGAVHFPYAALNSLQYSPALARYLQQRDAQLTTDELNDEPDDDNDDT